MRAEEYRKWLEMVWMDLLYRLEILKGMSNAILKLIDDAELCFQMGEDAIKHFNESFKLEIMGKEYAELLQDG